MLEKLLDIVFPKLCLKCKKQGEGYICSSCFLSFLIDLKFEKIYKKTYDYLIYLDKYESLLRKSILEMKFGEKAYLTEVYAKFLTKNEKINEFLREFEYIIPVPMHISKKNLRGYNQTELLAKSISEKLNIKYEENFLLKIRKNQTQSLLSKEKRVWNVEKSFSVSNIEKIFNKKVILVDDIFTTGATVHECSNVLKMNGVSEICVLVIAKS